MVLAFCGLLSGVSGGGVELLPPGHRPLPPGLHVLQAGRVVIRPGQELRGGMILIRDGRIEAVGTDVDVPPGARVWDLPDSTVYAGFLDMHVVLEGGAVDSTGVQVVEERGQDLTSGSVRFFGVPGEERDAGRPGPGYELGVVRPEVRAIDGWVPDEDLEKSLRQLGFAAANLVPVKGVLRGQSGLVSLGDASPNRAVLRPSVFQHVALDTDASGGGGHYPRSLMGVIAVVRQALLDGRYYLDGGDGKPNAFFGYNESLEALGAAMSGRQAVVFEPGSVLMNVRAATIAEEMGLDYLLVACGQEWRRPDLVAATGARYIVQVNFPEVPKLPDDSDWEQVELDLLRAWDWAPENPAVLRERGLGVALTTAGLKDRKDFRRKLRLAIGRGFSRHDALAALTTVPAAWCGVAGELGTIEPGKLANLAVVNGDYFEPEAEVQGVWVEGVWHPVISPRKKAGKQGDKKKDAEDDVRLAESPMLGRGPLTEAGVPVCFRNATVWTCGPEGVLEGADVLVGADGKIIGVGVGLLARVRLSVKPLEVDATGLHMTPGLIDCHSHSFVLGAVNEMSLPSTAMVRIGDVVNSESPFIYEQLAGGLTVANLLHGSANPIGGQNAVVKLRWGAGPEEMKLGGAPEGIKFALGENVKQSYRAEPGTRFPQSRMGVPVFMENRFTAAKEYLAAWGRFESGQGEQPRRDLELEALGEILRGERLIHCHSYRQDEIVVFLRTMEAFGVRVGTLQHVLEGYKVADEIAAHGAGASAFADWWGYKYEVRDAIPYAGAILHERGVVVSFNSDSSDFARVLNREAAKAVKYGGVDEAEALKFVTLNPAKQLGIDEWVGSLEPGKDGDVVVWSGHPFAADSVCLQTWIEGRQYFDRSREGARVEGLRLERQRLLAKVRKESGEKNGDEGAAENDSMDFFRSALEMYRGFEYSCCEGH